MSGSSTERVCARWLSAALEEPYGPQVEYDDMAAPEEVRRMVPWVVRR